MYLQVCAWAIWQKQITLSKWWESEHVAEDPAFRLTFALWEKKARQLQPEQNFSLTLFILFYPHCCYYYYFQFETWETVLLYSGFKMQCSLWLLYCTFLACIHSHWCTTRLSLFFFVTFHLSFLSISFFFCPSVPPHFFIIIIIIIFFILERGFHKETLKFLSRVFDSRREAAVGACSAVSGCVFSVFSLLASWWQGN